MTAGLSLGFAFAFVVAVQGWDYGLDRYQPAPYYHGQAQQYELSTCPPSGPEELVCAGITGSEPYTFPSACEVARFRAVTGKDWQIIHEGRCDNLEVCPGHCRNQYSPVCGKFKDERRNFNSECELQLVKCRTGDPWRKQHDGPCESRYPAGQSLRVRNYNPYAVNPYPSHQGYSGSQGSYGSYGSQGAYGSQAAYVSQGSYGTQGAYVSQGAYGSQDGYQGSLDSHRSFVPNGHYSPYAISSQSQPSFVSPPPPYKAPVYYPYEITWENLPTEFGIHGKSYENLPTEYPAPGSNGNSYEKKPTDYATTSKPYEKPTNEKTTTYDSPTSDKPTYEKPTTYDSPTFDKPTYEKSNTYDSPTSDKPTYGKPVYNSTTTSTTSTTSTTTTSTTEKTTAAPTTTPQPEADATTQASDPRQNIKVNAVVEAPVAKSTNESLTTASPTEAPVTVKAAPLTKYATTATPQHATTTPRPKLEKVIKINAVQEKGNSSTTTTTTTKAPKMYTVYQSSRIQTTTEQVEKTSRASLDKLIKINAAQSTTNTTEKSTTKKQTTVKPTTYKSYPTYQSPSSYSSYPTYQASESYKSPPVYTTTEKPKVTETTKTPLDKLIKINAVTETAKTTGESTTEESTTKESTTEESTTEKSTTEESTTEEPKTYSSYPKTYNSYPSYQDKSSYNSSYPTYETPSYYKKPPVNTTTEQPKVTKTTKASLDKVIKINAAVETKTSTTKEPTTYKSNPASYKAYNTYPSYPTYEAPSTYKTSTTKSPKVTETTKPALEKVIKINKVEEPTTTTDEPKTSTEEPLTTSTEEPTTSTEEPTTTSTEEPKTYSSYPTYQATSYPTYQAPSPNGAYTVSSYKDSSSDYKSQETYEKKTYPAAYSGDSPVIVKTVNGSTFTKMYVEVPGKTGAKKFSLETSAGDNKSNLQQVYFLTFN